MKIKSERTVSKLAESEKKEILKELEDVVGSEWVSDDPAFGAPWGRDQSSRVDEPTYYPDFVILPESAEEVSKIMKIANKHKVQVAVGAGGANVGGRLMMHNGGIVIDTRRLDRILEIDEESMTATVEAGVSHSRLRAEVNKKGLRCDVPGAPTSSSVIANLCLLGGEHFNNTRYNYGITKLLGTEIVTPTGKIIRTGQLAFPNAKPGMCGPDWDLSTLAAGSLGLAGIVTKGVIKLFPLGDRKKYKKLLDFGFFADFPSALTALAELAVEDLGKAIGEAGPKYYAGSLPTATLEGHLKMVHTLARAYRAIVWIDMEGTVEQVEYQKKRVREILESHGADITLSPILQLMFNKPTREKEAVRYIKNALGIDVPEHWLSRAAEMFDVSEFPCRGFGVGGQTLVGTFSQGVANCTKVSDIFHDLMKRENYPGYGEGMWASYGTIFRGSTAKIQELDVHFDRLDPEYCDARERFTATFMRETAEKGVLLCTPLGSMMSFLLVGRILSLKIGKVWFGLRNLLDPNGVMHKHRIYDKLGVKI